MRRIGINGQQLDYLAIDDCVVRPAVQCLRFSRQRPAGWRHLGRDVSMSLLEIARAFAAPVLLAADANASGNDTRKSLGNEKIRFVAMQGDAPQEEHVALTQYVAESGRGFTAG